MKSISKIIRNVIFFVLLIVITFTVIFNNHDINDTFKILLNVKIGYVLLGIIAMISYLLIESYNVKEIISSLGKKIPLLKMFKYTLIGFFFSGVTPAASGGQPMEIYYMNKEKIPVNYSTIALLLELCSFHIVTLPLGIVGAIINHRLLPNGFIIVFFIGMMLNSTALSFMLIGLFSKKISKKLVNLFLKILEIFRFKDIEDKKEKIELSLKEYHESSNFIKNNKIIFIKSIIIVFFQIIVYYTIPYFVYRSFGLNNYRVIEIILIQAMLYISTSSVPLPGSVGISESIFLKIYLTIFGLKILPSAMLLNRFINFYLFVLIGLIVTIINAIYLKKRKIKN